MAMPKRCLILAGGKGTRLYPLTHAIPKPLVPLVNRPFLEHVLDRLSAQGIQEVILATAHMAEALAERLGDGRRFGLTLEYLVEETPLDSGGAIKHAESHLAGEPFFVLNGDILTELDLAEMAEFHEQCGAAVTISLARVEDPSAYGVVELEDRRVVRFVEKPPPEAVRSHFVNAGTWLFDPGMVERMPRGRPFSIEREFFPDLLRDEVPMYGYLEPGYWLDIGTVSKYLQAHRDILLGKLSLELPGDPAAAGVRAGAGTRIAAGVHLEPPVLLGRNVSIATGATLLAGTCVGDDVTVEEGALIEASVLWAGVRVGARAQLRRCVVGHGRQIPPDAILTDQVVEDAPGGGAGEGDDSRRG
jgi:mannose-1-phosphate guanylyltransferase